jgi:hypothetical protein
VFVLIEFIPAAFVLVEFLPAMFVLPDIFFSVYLNKVLECRCPTELILLYTYTHKQRDWKNLSCFDSYCLLPV